MKRLVLIILLLLPVQAFAYSSPGLPTGYVNDFAGLLRPETVTTLNTRLKQIATSTGSEISVVTIDKLEDETIETYAEKLFQEWEIGKANEDNGLLLLISREDRMARIEVGYGLEPVITDIESGKIIREILVPEFQNENYDLGVINTINALIASVENEEDYVTDDTDSENQDSLIFMIILVLGFILLMYLLRNHFKNGGGSPRTPRRPGRISSSPRSIPKIFGGGSSGGGGASGRW